MPSNSSRGAHFRARSKTWAERHGYPVAIMELQRLVHAPHGIFPHKKDQFGSDLIYLCPDGVVFLQVKGGGKPTKSLLKEAQDEFDQHRFPAACRLELHVWRSGMLMSKGPEIIECRKSHLLT